MLQISVTVYCLMLWAGVAVVAHVPDTPLTVAAFLLAAVIVLLHVTPAVVRSLLGLVTLTPIGPPRPAAHSEPAPVLLPGARGRRGSVQVRAPNVAFAL